MSFLIILYFIIILFSISSLMMALNDLTGPCNKPLAQTSYLYSVSFLCTMMS